MTAAMSLPPSVTVESANVDVFVLTEDGATVQVSLPSPRGLRELPRDELVARARRLAKVALEAAAEALSQNSLPFPV